MSPSQGTIDGPSGGGSARLSELLLSYLVPQALRVAAELRLPDLLHAGPKTARELAQESASDAWTLEVVLRLLAALALLTEEADGRFGLTPLAALLSETAPGPAWALATLRSAESYQAAGELLHAVRTGDVAFDHLHGMSFYDYLGRHPTASAKFNALMLALAPNRYADLPTAFEFSTVGTLVDAGSGEGGLTCLLLTTYPHLRAVLFDAPPVIARAKERVAAAGVSARCELVGGSFLEAVPQGGDVYLLANVLNNWRDEQARQILRHCRRVMAERSRLLVVEGMYFPGEPLLRALVGVMVMVERGGRPRSEAENRALLESRGLRPIRAQRLSHQNQMLIEAAPA